MNASTARRLQNFEIALIALSAPTLLNDVALPIRPPVAKAPLAQSLTIRELAMLARVRREVAHA